MSITISRTSLGLIPLTAAETGNTGAVLAAFTPGGIERINEYSQSADLPGAQLARTRDDMTTIDVTLQLWAAAGSAQVALYDTWAAALGQFTYTLKYDYTGGSRTYNCCPATLVPVHDPVRLRAGLLLVTTTIPRQP